MRQERLISAILTISSTLTLEKSNLQAKTNVVMGWVDRTFDETLIRHLTNSIREPRSQDLILEKNFKLYIG